MEEQFKLIPLLLLTQNEKGNFDMFDRHFGLCLRPYRKALIESRKTWIILMFKFTVLIECIQIRFQWNDTRVECWSLLARGYEYRSDGV